VDRIFPRSWNVAFEMAVNTKLEEKKICRLGKYGLVQGALSTSIPTLDEVL
jgi:hypothetical protein